MIRAAWVGRGQYRCSYCNTNLGIEVMWLGDGRLSLARGWTRDASGRLVYRRPKRMGADALPGEGRSRWTARDIPRDVQIVCRNPDCGELLILPNREA
jgi:hypothetical protein